LRNVRAEVLRGAPTALRRHSGRAGRNATSGRDVGQVCANGGATKLHRWFSWAPLTKCRCSEIVLGEANVCVSSAQFFQDDSTAFGPDLPDLSDDKAIPTL